MLRLELFPGHDYSLAHGVNDDGSVIVGTSGYTQARCPRGFLWRETTGKSELLMSPGNDDCGEARAVNGSGSLVAGSSTRFAIGMGPMMWRDGVGVRLPVLPDFAYGPRVESRRGAVTWGL